MIMKKTEGKAGRPVIKHGAFSYLTRLTLPDNRAYLRPYLSSVREGLVRDLGPIEEGLTTGQKLLIDRTVGLVGVIRLIEEHVREQGVFHGGILIPVLANNYTAFTNSLRLNLQALGIDKRSGERILSPLEIAAEIDKEKADTETREAGGRARMPQDRLSSEDSAKVTDKSDGWEFNTSYARAVEQVREEDGGG
jgi:hypothetical protein